MFNTEKYPKRPRLFLLVSILWFCLASQSLWQFLLIEVNGTIANVQYIPGKDTPRYSAEYTIRAPDGRNQIYIAGCTDGSLPRDFPVGTSLKKLKWHLSYEKNGALISTYPIFVNYVRLALMTGMAVWNFGRWRKGLF